MTGQPWTTLPPIDRFLSQVEFGPRRQDGTYCLLYLGTDTGRGWRRFVVGGRRYQAHRWLYEQWVGPIPDGLQLDHLCRVRNCVNPLHLEPVTTEENVRRERAAAEPLTHCKRHHEMTEANTYRQPNGRRECRTCRQDRRPISSTADDGLHPSPAA